MGPGLKEKGWLVTSYPILLDRNVEAASLGEYFWQDLLVAKEIIKLSRVRHVDVNSRIDGFIAHLACARNVEVFDIPPLTSEIENVEFSAYRVLILQPLFIRRASLQSRSNASFT